MNHNTILNSYDISIIVSSINPDRWPIVYEQAAKAIKTHTFELVIISPYYPTEEMHDKKNVKFIRDFGCPSRCFQLGTTVATGRYIALITDDSLIEEDALEECVVFLDGKRKEDCVALMYSEGPNYTGNQYAIPNYWKPYYHQSLQLVGINPNWTVDTNFLMRTDFFREMGGLDCAYEALNMNIHDLMFRVQAMGGIFYPSAKKVYSINHNPDAYAGNHNAVQKAYEENDLPRFTAKYSNPYPSLEPIDYNNWMKAPSIWPRRAEKYAKS